MSQYLQDLEPIAREAGALLMTYFDRHIKIEYKGDVDLVTAADRASEKLIVERLQARWPQHGIVGEEGTRSDTGRIIAGSSILWTAPRISHMAIPCSASRSRWRAKMTSLRPAFSTIRRAMNCLPPSVGQERP